MGILCVYPFRPCNKSLFVPFTVNDDDIDDIPFNTGKRMITISSLSSVNGIKCFTRIGRIAIVAQSRHIFSFH